MSFHQAIPYFLHNLQPVLLRQSGAGRASRAFSVRLKTTVPAQMQILFPKHV